MMLDDVWMMFWVFVVCGVLAMRRRKRVKGKVGVGRRVRMLVVSYGLVCIQVSFFRNVSIYEQVMRFFNFTVPCQHSFPN